MGKNVEHLTTKQYAVPLTDQTGLEWIVYAYGMEEITTEANKVNIAQLKRIFGLTPEISLFRPHGNVDMLIGADCCCIMPQVVVSKDNLQLMRNQFGLCVRGYHPNLRVEGVDAYTVRVNHVSVMTDINDMNFEPMKGFKEEIDNYFRIDHLGTDCKPKCDSCKVCKECNKEKPMNVKEEKEMKMILSGLVYNAEDKYWTINYPWIDNPDKLPNNFGISMMRLKGTERRLRKLGHEYSRAYNNQMHDMIKRKVARILKERKERNGRI